MLVQLKYDLSFNQLYFPCGSVIKEPACQHRRCKLDPWVGKIPWKRKWQPIWLNTRILQYSCLSNLMDRGAWWTTVHGVVKSQTGLTEHSLSSWSHPWLASHGIFFSLFLLLPPFFLGVPLFSLFSFLLLPLFWFPDPGAECMH